MADYLNKKAACWAFPAVSSDKRDVEKAAAEGNARAKLASDMLNYQIKNMWARNARPWRHRLPGVHRRHRRERRLCAQRGVQGYGVSGYLYRR